MKKAFLKQEAEVFAISKEWRRIGHYFIKPDRLISINSKNKQNPAFSYLKFKI